MPVFRKGLIFAVSTITMKELPLTKIPVMDMEGGIEAFGRVMLNMTFPHTASDED